MNHGHNKVMCNRSHTRKVLFRTQKDAENCIMSITDKIKDVYKKYPVRIYYCDECQGYHLTSQGHIRHEWIEDGSAVEMSLPEREYVLPMQHKGIAKKERKKHNVGKDYDCMENKFLRLSEAVGTIELNHSFSQLKQIYDTVNKYTNHVYYTGRRYELLAKIQHRIREVEIMIEARRCGFVSHDLVSIRPLPSIKEQRGRNACYMKLMKYEVENLERCFLFDESDTKRFCFVSADIMEEDLTPVYKAFANNKAWEDGAYLQPDEVSGLKERFVRLNGFIDELINEESDDTNNMFFSVLQKYRGIMESRIELFQTFKIIQRRNKSSDSYKPEPIEPSSEDFTYIINVMTEEKEILSRYFLTDNNTFKNDVFLQDLISASKEIKKVHKGCVKKVNALDMDKLFCADASICENAMHVLTFLKDALVPIKQTVDEQENQKIIGKLRALVDRIDYSIELIEYVFQIEKQDEKVTVLAQ